MNEFLVIGMTGAARSGKDTVADYLCTEYDYGRIAFADPIKAMVCSLLKITPESLEANKDSPIPGLGTPRRMLQTLGTEWGRELIDDEIWIKLARTEIFRMRNDRRYSGVIITDVRFQNEAEMIHELDGVLWRTDRMDCPAVEDHLSEKGIDPAYLEYIIPNNGTLEELYDTVESIL